MATADEIAALRLLIAEPTIETYSDDALNARLDNSASMDIAAYEIWVEKAAAAATLVDIVEGGSTRRMGELHEQALTMAETFRRRALSPVNPPDDSGAGVRIRRLARP